MTEIRPGNYRCIKPSRLATSAFNLSIDDLKKLEEQGRGSEAYVRLTTLICPDCPFNCPKGRTLQLLRAQFPIPEDE